MPKKEIFYEKQKVRQWWIWLIVISLVALSVYAFTQQIIFGQTFGYNPISNIGLIMIMLLALSLFFFLLIIRLEIKISSTQIYFRLFPFHISYRCFERENIKVLKVIKYNSFREYGGWGFRIGFFGNKKAYNISGNHGLLLEFNNGKKIIIGTRKEKEISKIL